MSKKSAIVMLCVLGALYVAVLIYGGTHDAGGAIDTDSGGMQRLRSWLIEGPRTQLHLADVGVRQGASGDFRAPEDRILLLATGTWEIRIAASESQSLRRLTPTLESGGPLSATWEPAQEEGERPADPVEFTLEPEQGKNSQELMVESGGGLLRLQNPAALGQMTKLRLAE